MRIIQNQKGFLLLTVTVLGSVLFAAALSYMDLVLGQATMVRSSKHSLASKSAADAGIDEASWELSYDHASFPVANGWSSPAAGTYTKTVGLTDAATNSLSAYYTTTVTKANSSAPVVTVVGRSVDGATTITRTATFALKSPYSGSVTAQGSIALLDNSYTDSYDSSKGDYGGTNILSNGNIQTNFSGDGNNASISMSLSAVVHGNAGMGAGGRIDYGVADPGQNLITGNTYYGVSSDILANTVPSSMTSLPDLGAINNSTTLNSGAYRYSTIKPNDGQTIQISGNVSLYLTGSVNSIESQATDHAPVFSIDPGAKLTIYCDGNVLVANNAVNNNNGTRDPSSFQLYGTSNCTALTFGNSAELSGIINAPNADVALAGNSDLYGYVVAKTMTMKNNSAVHYDEHLLTSGPGLVYKLCYSGRSPGSSCSLSSATPSSDPSLSSPSSSGELTATSPQNPSQRVVDF